MVPLPEKPKIVLLATQTTGPTDTKLGMHTQFDYRTNIGWFSPGHIKLKIVGMYVCIFVWSYFIIEAPDKMKPLLRVDTSFTKDEF